MRRRGTSLVATIATIAIIAIATPATASGPSGGGTPYANYRICKGGPNAGADCTMDVQCPKSECVLDWVKGQGSSLSATITAFMDDQVRDFRDGVDTNNQAVVVILQLKYGGEKHMLAEVYQDKDDPTNQPEVLGWGGTAFFEDDWNTIDCEDFLYAQPEEKMRDALLAIAGQPSTKTPIVRKAKKKTESYDHDFADPLGTGLICKLKFGFLNEP